ncbi:hypothetical protein DPMN_005482 [Dreissena polymorpha]|uniref:Uncharacterized protein n=1 Tax=Dreissena polymorpha TaxID=45954 RepID=A0A9D4MSA0_DREPO|nr:hypothetical protein DPMN_005482 [Dreissena polymorpha]
MNDKVMARKACSADPPAHQPGSPTARQPARPPARPPADIRQSNNQFFPSENMVTNCNSHTARYVAAGNIM